MNTRTYAFLLAVLILNPPSILSAQDKCADADLLSIKGSWKQNADANMRNTQDKDRLLRNLDSIGQLFRAAYPEPKGMEAVWYRSMRDPDLPGLVAYTSNSGYFAWYCNQNLHKAMLGEETGTWAYVFVNSLAHFLDRYDKIHLTNGASLYALPAPIGAWKGYKLYQPPGYASGRCVLLTRRGHLPWRTVSQEEYLRALNVNIDDNIRAFKANPSIADNFYNPKKKKIEDYLKHTDTVTLRQPAILPFNGQLGFEGYFTTEEKGGRAVVTIDPAYFDKRLPGYRPQVMILEWRWSNNPPSQEFKRKFEADFPVERLQLMLDE